MGYTSTWDDIMAGSTVDAGKVDRIVLGRALLVRVHVLASKIGCGEMYVGVRVEDRVVRTRTSRYSEKRQYSCTSLECREIVRGRVARNVLYFDGKMEFVLFANRRCTA